MRARRVFLSVLLVAALSACSSHEEHEEKHERKPRPIVVLMTDFGSKDDAVGLLKGVILDIARDAAVVDLCHEVPAYDIEAGAQILEDAPGLYPSGTVFVAVVDPGVGTARRPIAALLENGTYLVGPDNGVLSYAMDKWRTRTVRVIENRAFMRGDVSTTFHGRDIFTPAAAHMARTDTVFAAIGPALKEWTVLERPKIVVEGTTLRAAVTAIDEPFGNLWTNVERTDLERVPAGTPKPPPAEVGRTGAKVQTIVFDFGSGKTVSAPLVHTFGDVTEGKPLAYWNSRGRLSLAINMGDARKTYGIARGAKVTVSRE